VQIVGYDTGTSGLSYDPVDGARGDVEPAALKIADDGDVHSRSLAPGSELAYTLDDRHCAGTTDDGIHVPCRAETAPYCETHSSTWLCAQCRGNCNLPLDTCREEHAVYLAAFAAGLFKVGVTRQWRLVTRLRVQGADRGALVRVVSNGRIARDVESEIASSITDRVTVPGKIAGMGREVDEEAWSALLADFDPGETFDFDYGLDLDGRPVAETLATGTVRGTKGRLLVLDHGASTYAIDLRDLVGREVRSEPTDRDLQSSLRAFGSPS